MNQHSKGTLSATIAFSLWAILPIYWKHLQDVPVFELTSHRVIWLLFFLIPILIWRRSFWTTLRSFRSRRALTIHSLAAICLGCNWLLYIWAVHTDRIIEGALGYYLNPFLNILIGRLFLGEKQTRIQFIAILVAAFGVALQFPAVKQFPWLAISLALSFAAYGFLRKKSPLGSFSGLGIESAFLFPIAFIFLLKNSTVFGGSSSDTLLLIGSGIATAAPLLFFAHGARKISLTLLGIIQFIGPTGQFLIGWLIYNEPLPLLRLVSFALIWIAVILYILSLRQKDSPENQAQ